MNFYGRTLSARIAASGYHASDPAATIGALTVYLYIRVPKGFFPQQDTGRLTGQIQADQDTSFQAMDKILLQMVNIIDADPAIDTVNAFSGGGGGTTTNTARMFIALKPLSERKVTADQIIAAAAAETGARARSHVVFAVRSGSAGGRPPEQRAVSVHHARRQFDRSDRLRAAHAG